MRRYNELQLGAEARLELERLRDEGVDALGHLGRGAHLVRVRVGVSFGVGAGAGVGVGVGVGVRVWVWVWVGVRVGVRVGVSGQG